MNVSEQIRVLDLLRQREAEFVKVWQCEEGIRRLLGLSDFPFDPVPELPSRIKGHARIRISGVSDRRETSAERTMRGSVPSIRRLYDSEDAYHLVYECEHERASSFQRDNALIRQLFQLQGKGFRLLRVETAVFRSLEDWECGELLWENGASDSQESIDSDSCNEDGDCKKTTLTT